MIDKKSLQQQCKRKKMIVGTVIVSLFHINAQYIPVNKLFKEFIKRIKIG